MLDLAIIGAGPAALSAAIYAARAHIDVAVFEKASFGGLLNEISNIENFPGFAGSGANLAESIKKQAAAAGAKLTYGECTEVVFDQSKSSFKLTIDDEDVFAKTVLIATGSEPKHLPFQIQKPVSYCVLCDGNLYQGKNVAMVGGGNSAVQESLYLAGIVEKLTLISRSALRAEPHLIEQLTKHSNVEILDNTSASEALLNQFDGVFVCIGKRPATSFLPPKILNHDGYIETQRHATKIPGLFAAGDVRDGNAKQAITAAGDGAAAALEIIEFLKDIT